MTIKLHGNRCYYGKNGCLDAYCSTKKLIDKEKLKSFFFKLKNKDGEVIKIWKEYIDYLVVSLINIHTLLDYKIIIGGYIGGYIEDYIPEIWQKISEQDIFKSDCYISASKFKMEASALGVALSIIEKFISEI